MESTRRHRLQAFLDSRNVTERSLLLMYYVDQLTPQEISLVVDLPLGEVVRRLSSLIVLAREVLTAQPASSAAIAASA
jgi:DNA-directed RNA polymerase specialized sigma24 family protein